MRGRVKLQRVCPSPPPSQPKSDTSDSAGHSGDQTRVYPSLVAPRAGAGQVCGTAVCQPPRNYADERGRGARSHPRSAGRVDHRLSHRRRDDHHLRGGGASLRREQFRGACHMGRRPWPRLGPGRRGGGLPLAHLDQSVLGAGARHLHVRVDGQIRRRARRAHRHPCGRRRLRQAAYPRDAASR